MAPHGWPCSTQKYVSQVTVALKAQEINAEIKRRKIVNFILVCLYSFSLLYVCSTFPSPFCSSPGNRFLSSMSKFSQKTLPCRENSAQKIQKEIKNIATKISSAKRCTTIAFSDILAFLEVIEMILIF